MDNNQAFLVDVTGHLCDLIKELEGNDKLITETQVKTKTFKVKHQMRRKPKLHNAAHFPHLTSLDAIYPEHNQQYCQSILLH
jgi:hypothetical protein